MHHNDGEIVKTIAGLVPVPKVVEINGRQKLFVPEFGGADGTVKYERDDSVPDQEAAVPMLSLESLGSLVAYLTANRDELKLETLMICICGPDDVDLVSNLRGAYNERHTYAEVKAMTAAFSYGTFLDHETFLISLQSAFTQTKERDDLLALLGNIKTENVSTSVDDGVSQQVTVRRGAALVDNTLVPKRVRLAPWRTFSEIDQPESEFVLRLREGGPGGKPSLALFTADNGRWRLEAQQRIATWLEDKLGELDVPVIW